MTAGRCGAQRSEMQMLVGRIGCDEIVHSNVVLAVTSKVIACWIGGYEISDSNVVLAVMG